MAARKPSRKAGSHPPRKKPPKTDQPPADSAAESVPEEATPPTPQPSCHGIRCPRCHSSRNRVRYTRLRPNGKRRVRDCLDCCRRFITTESVC